MFLESNKSQGIVATPLGPVYTKHQHQCCINSVITLAILFSFKSVESLENRLQSHSVATPLFSVRKEIASAITELC